MKKNIFFFIILLFFYFPTVKGQFSIGIKSGLTFSKVKYVNNDINRLMKNFMQTKAGINGGIITQYYFVRGLAIQPEFYYSGKGFKYEQQYIEGKKRFDYLQLSIAGKVSTDPREEQIFAFYIAPFTSFWTSGKRWEVDSKDNESHESNFDFENDEYTYNRWDAGILIGVEFRKTQTKHRQWLIDIRYEHGFISNNITSVDGTLNRVIYLSFGYMFSW